MSPFRSRFPALLTASVLAAFCSVPARAGTDGPPDAYPPTSASITSCAQRRTTAASCLGLDREILAVRRCAARQGARAARVEVGEGGRAVAGGRCVLRGDHGDFRRDDQRARCRRRGSRGRDRRPPRESHRDMAAGTTTASMATRRSASASRAATCSPHRRVTTCSRPMRRTSAIATATRSRLARVEPQRRERAPRETVGDGFGEVLRRRPDRRRGRRGRRRRRRGRALHGTGFAAPSRPSGRWSRPTRRLPYQGKTLEPICSKGTPWVFFVKRGTVNKTLMYYQGGGACWDYASCSLPTHKTSTGAFDNPAGAAVASQPLEAREPVPRLERGVRSYCTGDVHWGDAVVDHTTRTASRASRSTTRGT